MAESTIIPAGYWSRPPQELLDALGSSPSGLTAAEASRRLAQVGPNLLRAKPQVTVLRLLANQFKNPIVLILIAGFLLFFDPPKPGVQETITDLAGLGVGLKIITGDNHLVALHTAQAVGLKVTGLLTGADLDNLHDETLWQAVERTNLFSQVDPNQKERIILAAQKRGHADFPAMAIAGDSVDREMVEKPRRWNIGFVRNFMFTFGTVSSVFDYLTFGLLLLVLHVGQDQFRTAWFLESVMTELMIMLVIRTQKPFFRSKPGRYLILGTLIVAAVTLLLPYSPLSKPLGFTPLPLPLLLTLLVISGLYVLASEAAKRVFYQQVRF